MRKYIQLFVVFVFTVGCASVRMEEMDATAPELVLEEYFNGRLTAYGMLKDRRGRVTSRFRAEFNGFWDDQGNGTLDEIFRYDDGEIQKRSWTFRPDGQNRYIGTASDIVGDAPMLLSGNTLRMDYVIRVPYKGSSIDLSVRDWLHLQDDGVMLNHSYMRKYGFRVAELVVTIIKDYPPAEDARD